MFLPHFVVFCDLLYHWLYWTVWTDARQHGIYLFYIITKQTTRDKAFFISKYFNIRESRPLPTLTNTNKSHLSWSMFYTKWSNFICYYGEQRIVIGREKSRHCQTWLDRRFSWNENLQKTFCHFKTAEGKTLWWWRQPCICPLIDYTRVPIEMRQ